MAGKSTWTVMVYLAGKNNLGEECVFSLTELKRIGPGKGVKVIAQLDSSIYDGAEIIVQKGEKPGALNHELQAGKVRGALSATGRRLTYFEEILSFIEGSIRTHRAHHYMLILSGHGHGSVGDFLSEGQANKIQGLSIPSLGKLIEKVNKVIAKTSGTPNKQNKLDILGMD